VAGCTDFALGHGDLCSRHYQRKRRHGSVDITLKGANGSTFTEVLEAVASSTDECIIRKSTPNNPYGFATLPDGRRMPMSRAVCTVAHGEPPAYGLDAAHSCGDTHCINPRHLSWKPRKANNEDKVAQGTQISGEAVNLAKLTDEQAREIFLSTAHSADLATKYDVSRATINRIRNRVTYRGATKDL
jgi:hypothetical protein